MAVVKRHVEGKEKKEQSAGFAKGGSNKMFGQGGAAQAEAGVTANMKQGGNNKFEFNQGTGKMVGPQAADPQAPGVTGHDAGSSQKWGLPPSKGHMAGWTGAQTAKPA